MQSRLIVHVQVSDRDERAACLWNQHAVNRRLLLGLRYGARLGENFDSVSDRYCYDRNSGVDLPLKATVPPVSPVN